MTGSEFEQRYVRNILAFAGAYESLALTTRKVPTISGMVWWLYKRWWGQAILWGVWGWLTAHFFREVAHEVAQVAAEEERKMFRALLKRREANG